jgi:hypothetical protein
LFCAELLRLRQVEATVGTPGLDGFIALPDFGKDSVLRFTQNLTQNSTELDFESCGVEVINPFELAA